MSSALSFNLADYPDLARIIQGQQVTLKIKVRAGMKVMNENGEYYSFLPEAIEIEEGRKPTVQEILLASMNDSLNRQKIATP